jgi:DNA primase
MPAIPESTVEEVRQRADIVALIEGYVPLKRRGHDYWACCPFHHEKTPSFKVSPQFQTYYCFGCKKSGNAFTFVMERENVDFVGAIRLLAQKYGVTIPEPEAPRGAGPARQGSRDRLYGLLAAAAAWYRQCLLRDPAAERARAYLAERGLPEAAAHTFGLGYAVDAWDALLRWGQRHDYPPELLVEAGLLVERDGAAAAGRSDPGYDRFRGRLMFPIWDELGRVVGFSGRILDKDAAVAKYVNTPETPLFHKSRLLYALHLARTAFKEHGHALICEGQLDVIACHRAGCNHAVAPQGTAFTDQHALLLRRFTADITFAFDGDPAGIQAALRSFEVALNAGLRPKVVLLPPGEDPDSLFRRRGGDALKETLAQAQDPVRFAYDLAAREHDPASVDGRSRIADRVLALVALFPEPVTRAGHAQWLAHTLRLPEQALFQALERNRQAGSRGSQRPGAGPPPPPLGRHAAAAPADPVLVTERTLLSLVLRDAEVARAVHDQLPADDISDSPVGLALNRVLAMAGEGEWDGAAAELARDSELTSDADVGRAQADEEYAPPAGSEEAGIRRNEYRQRLWRAAEDCLGRLRREQRQRRLAALLAAAKQETDPNRRLELYAEYGQLAREVATRRDDAVRLRQPPSAVHASPQLSAPVPEPSGEQDFPGTDLDGSA